MALPKNNTSGVPTTDYAGPGVGVKIIKSDDPIAAAEAANEAYRAAQASGTGPGISPTYYNPTVPTQTAKTTRDLSYSTPGQIDQYMRGAGAGSLTFENTNPDTYLGPRVAGTGQGGRSAALRDRASKLLGIPINPNISDQALITMLTQFNEQTPYGGIAQGTPSMDAIDQLLRIAEGTGIQSFADGGRVSRPTVALVGENGPELAMLQSGDLILPLPKKQSKKVEKMPGIPKMQNGGMIEDNTYFGGGPGRTMRGGPDQPLDRDFYLTGELKEVLERPGVGQPLEPTMVYPYKPYEQSRLLGDVRDFAGQWRFGQEPNLRVGTRFPIHGSPTMGEDIRFEQTSGVPENRTNYAQNLIRGLTGAAGGLFGDAPGRNKRLYDEYMKDQMTNPNQMSFEQFVLNRPVDIGDGQTMPLSQFQSLQQGRKSIDFDPFETARTYQEAAATRPGFMPGMAIGVNNPLYNLGVIPGGQVSGMTAGANEADLMARAAAAQMPDPSLAPVAPPSVSTDVPPSSTATPESAKTNANITVAGQELGIDAGEVNAVRSTGDNFGFDIVEILAAARSPEGVTPDMYASLVSGLGDSEARMNVAGRRVEEIQSVINAIIPAEYDPRLDEQLAAAQLEQLEATREFETLEELNRKVEALDQRTFDEKRIAQTRANQEADAELKRMNELEDAERERQQLISDDLRDRERELQDLEDERLREDQMQAERLQLGRAATREERQYQQQQQQDMANSVRQLFKSLGIDLPEGSLAGISPEMMPQILQMLFSMQRQQYAPPTVARFGFA